MYHTTPFIHLGRLIGSILRERPAVFGELVRLAQADNPWFTADSVRLALNAVTNQMLRPEKLEQWLEAYPYPAGFTAKNVGIVMAGNIPLVGFFDLLCVCTAGHRAYVKTSSKDRALMERVVRALRHADPSLVIRPLTDDSPLDAVIATGSNNTNRYFRSRYGAIPHLLRGNRTSIAVLTGRETTEDLSGLAHDVFDYFGMGCRNVSNIFVPKGYRIERLIKPLQERSISHPNYLHAYAHHKALLRMRGTEFIDGGFFTLRESAGFSEALPDLVYTPYETAGEVREWISHRTENLQCIVTHALDCDRKTGFGRAQHPELWDYPDGRDVMAFLRTI